MQYLTFISPGGWIGVLLLLIPSLRTLLSHTTPAWACLSVWTLFSFVAIWAWLDAWMWQVQVRTRSMWLRW